MRLKQLVIYLITITTVGITNCDAQIARQHKMKTDDELLNMIGRLPEVQAYFKKYGKHYRPAIVLYSKPDNTSKYYVVKLGIDHSDIFQTVDNFYIDSKNFTIWYLDTFDNDDNQLISLKLWRRWKDDRRFIVFHRFENDKLIVDSD